MMTFAPDVLAPLPRLLASYAGADAPRHRLVWAYDARLADIVRTTTEPLIGQMRLTWWHEVLSDAQGVKGRGDPLVDALRDAALPPFSLEGLLAMIDGWEQLLDAAPLNDAALEAYALKRGGGLFQALAGASLDMNGKRAGALWALWDLSGHVGDASLAARATALAGGFTGNARRAPPRGPLRILSRLAHHDVIRGRRGPSALTPGLYARLLRIGLIGR